MRRISTGHDANDGDISRLDPSPLLEIAHSARVSDARRAMDSESPGAAELAALLSPTASGLLEEMAARAQALTRARFGKTVSLYVPLYLSDYCESGCAYCGFAADRLGPRHRLSRNEAEREMDALKAMGFEEVLLLTGARTAQAGFDYLSNNVAMAAQRFHMVAVESFPMTESEYRALVRAGCSGVTLYQETYSRSTYAQVHRWGAKRDFEARLRAPILALSAGVRHFGMGALFGLDDPVREALCLYLHATALMKRFWRCGFSISFPRIRPEAGGFKPKHPVSDEFLARMVFAFRICLPDAHLVLSTRESPAFRDGMAGVGISKMSAVSRTTVGGYAAGNSRSHSQFAVSDDRPLSEIRAMLIAKGLEPVFKNWDSVFRNVS